MRRGGFACGGLAGLLVLAGCQTWQDAADADMLARCARIADPAKRSICQTEVMTAAGDAERRQLEAQREAGLARETQEALREAYGLPKDADD
jgi:hypothetical protein